MPDEQKNISAIILSAGKSERMGAPKFALKYDDQTTFLEKLIGEYHSFGCDEIIVVINPQGAELLHQLKLTTPAGVNFVINNHPEWERFYSLKLGTQALSNPKPVFVSNIDNPFITFRLLQTLIASTGRADYISPSFQHKGGHPMVLSTKIVSDIRDEACNQLHLKNYLAKYSRAMVEVDSNTVLLNINTMDDYARIFGL